MALTTSKTSNTFQAWEPFRLRSLTALSQGLLLILATIYFEVFMHTTIIFHMHGASLPVWGPLHTMKQPHCTSKS